MPMAFFLKNFKIYSSQSRSEDLSKEKASCEMAVVQRMVCSLKRIFRNAALAENVEVKQALTDAEKRNQRPSFLEYDAEKMTGKLLRWPDRAEMSYPVNEQLIVDLYSK